MPTAPDYLLAASTGEVTRLRLQSLVWQDAGRRAARLLRSTRPTTAVDLGCGALGWLRVLAELVGPGGEVVGTDVDPRLLAVAGELVSEAGLTGVDLRLDDVFDSRLPAAAYDVVHARFLAAPLGRTDELLAVMRRLVAPGGWLVLGDPDSTTWRYDGDPPALGRLVRLVVDAFAAAGGDFDAGLVHPAAARAHGLEVTVLHDTIRLEPGHPYLALPITMSRSLEPRLLELVTAHELGRLRAEATDELARPGAAGTTFTLVQTLARVP